MACKTCNKRNRITDQMEKTSDFVEKSVIRFFIVWSIFAIYGIVSFISDMISLLF